MPSKTRSGYRTPIAIGNNRRSIIARCLRLGIAQIYHDGIGDFSQREMQFALTAKQFFDGPTGVPMVSNEYVYRLLDLIRQLNDLKSRTKLGATLDHPWGFVSVRSDGFRLAAPGEKNTVGNWHSDDVLALAQEMYETHLISRGITDS